MTERVKRILEPSRFLFWRVYDDQSNEILLMIMDEGEMRFYKPIDEGVEEGVGT